MREHPHAEKMNLLGNLVRELALRFRGSFLADELDDLKQDARLKILTILAEDGDVHHYKYYKTAITNLFVDALRAKRAQKRNRGIRPTHYDTIAEEHTPGLRPRIANEHYNLHHL